MELATKAEVKDTPAPVSQPTEIESKAQEMGWRPKDQWEGDPEEWRSAKEFVDRKSLFDKIDSLKSTVWELKKDYKSVHENITKAERARFDAEILKLKAERKQAAKEGDTERVVDISDQLETAQAAVAQVAAAPTGPDPTFTEWVSANKWYTNNVDMKHDADAFGASYKAQNPQASFQEVLAHVTTRMKKVYPDEFGKRPTAPAVDGGGTTQRSPTRSGQPTEADLTDTERSVMAKYIKLKIYGNIPEAEAKAKYIKSLMTAKAK